MKTKLIFYSAFLLLGLVVAVASPIINYIDEAKDTKAQLEAMKLAETKNKKTITNTKNYVKKIKENINSGDIHYRRELLKKLYPSE